MKTVEISAIKLAASFCRVHLHMDNKAAVQVIRTLIPIFLEASEKWEKDIDIFSLIIVESLKKSLKKAEENCKPFSIVKEAEKVLFAAIDQASGQKDMLSSFENMKIGQAIAFHGRLSEKTGKRLFIRSTPLPIFPGDENFVKGLAKKTLKKGVFCTLTKGTNGSYAQSVYEIITQNDTLVAKKLQCALLRGASDAAYISGCKSALSGLSFR